jgi:hypothetical protein
MSSHKRFVFFVESQHHVINPTDFGGALHDGVEDRLYVGGRPADDAEHFGGRSLVLQGLGEVAIAFL